MASKKPGTHTWLWSLRKDAVISELEKYRVTIEPKATLAELRFLLKTELNKTRAANAGRAGQYDQLLIDLDQSEAELDNLETLGDVVEEDESDHDDVQLSDEEPTDDNQAIGTSETSQRERKLRAEIEAEERERLEAEEREERERRIREARDQAERDQEERLARETAERAEQELRGRLRQEIRARLLQEREEQRAYRLQLDAREVQIRHQVEQRRKEERDDHTHSRGNNQRSWLSKDIGQSSPNEDNGQSKQGNGIQRSGREDGTRRSGRATDPVNLPRAVGSNPGTPRLDHHQARSMDNSIELHRRDMVRKWGVVFKGERDILDFLERLEELAESYGYEMDDLLPCIPILLREKALLWYRNNKRAWVSWEDFVQDLKAFYLPPGLELELEEQIRNRVQGPIESAAEYATRIQTLMRRHGQMSPSARLTRLYQNLRPEYRRYMKRTEFSSVPELLRLAGELEQLSMQEKASSRRENKTTYAKTPASTKPSTSLELFEYNWRENCWRCRQKGHRKPECTNRWVKFCMRCGKMDTLSRDCPCPRQGNEARTGSSSQNRARDHQGAPNPAPYSQPTNQSTPQPSSSYQKK
ncbi:uncharacterized protein LOC141525928 [Cotesia typhae]|uniref:uncharacterized protein LOC141525928 n=1 Tax=Cotesia typhae TaxID=2053667 RepID=UPI003D68CE59